MIKEIVFGTTNPAKLQQIIDVLEPLGISVVGLNDFKITVKPSEESNDPVENAREKATVYAKATGRIVLAMDNGLYFDDLLEDQQPGVHVRRINGRADRPTDQELIDYYTVLVSRLGNKVKAYWRFGICIANPEKVIGGTEIISRRVFVSTPCQSAQVGYPLESLQIDPITGKYIAEMSDEERKTFWQNAIGKELGQFILNLKI